MKILKKFIWICPLLIILFISTEVMATKYQFHSYKPVPVTISAVRKGLCSPLNFTLNAEQKQYTGNDVTCAWESVTGTYTINGVTKSCTVNVPSRLQNATSDIWVSIDSRLQLVVTVKNILGQEDKALVECVY